MQRTPQHKREILIPLLCMILPFFFANSCTNDSEDSPSSPQPERSFPTGFLNVGHGGAKDLCPPNALECFQHALDMGANALEVDLQVLGDGTLVTFHDPNTLGQTGEDHDLEDLTWEEAKDLDAGWGFTPDNGQTYPWRGQGIRIPTFETFLRSFCRIPVLLDVKVDTQLMAQALEDFVSTRFGEDEREFVFIKSHDQALTNRLRSIEPPLAVAFNTWERILIAMCSVLVEDIPPTWLDLNPEYLLPWVVVWAESQGHILTTSTIDETGEMARYLAMEEMDGIVTNRPDLLKGLLDQ